MASPVEREPARRCEATRHDGKPCRSYACKGSRFCFSHDETKREYRMTVAAKGGRNSWARRLREVAEASSVNGASAILEILVEILVKLLRQRCTRFDVPRLRAAIYGCATAMDVAKHVEYGEQLDELQSILEEIQSGMNEHSVTVAAARTGKVAPWAMDVQPPPD